MATTKNSHFKVKVDRVLFLDQAEPEAGALIFSDNTKKLYLGDGYNWIEIDIDTVSKLALDLTVPVSFTWDATQVGTALPIDFFDTVVYRRGIFEPQIAPPTSVEIQGQTSAYLRQVIMLSSSENVTGVTLTWKRGSSDLIPPRQFSLPTRGNTYTFQVESPVQFLQGDIFNVTLAPDKACEIMIMGVTTGMHVIEGP